MFLGKGVLKIGSKFSGEHPCRSVVSIKMLCNFIEIILRHGCSPVNLLCIFRTSFYKNTSEGLLLVMIIQKIVLIVKCRSFRIVKVITKSRFHYVFSKAYQSNCEVLQLKSSKHTKLYSL